MLEAKNITFDIGKKKLLDDVSAAFEPGKLNLVIGPNGSGKSTFIKALCHQIKPQKGHVFYENVEVNEISLTKFARFRSVLSQNVEIAFPLSVAEVVMMGRYPHFTGKPTTKDEEICSETMEFFEISDLAERNYLTLSGGEKQRVHFARVTAQIWESGNKQFRYLFLDEPLTFLDVHYQFEFMHKILEMLKGNLVVVGVVHDLNLAARFAGHIVLLYKGKVLASGDKNEVLTKENIKTAYQIEPSIHHLNGMMYLNF